MNLWVLVWIQFNVFKGNTQTKTLKRVFADHIQSAFSSIQVFFKKTTESNYVTFSYGHFLVCFQCIDVILDIIMVKTLHWSLGEEKPARLRWSSVWKFYQVKLCLFYLKPVKKFFVYKCKLSLLVKGVVIHSVKRLFNLVLSLFMNKSTK